MAGARYIADPAEAVETVALDGLSLLFHAPSGSTHILAAPAPEIIGALREGPADAAELIRRLRTRFDLAEGEAEDAIRARLDELEAAGLVRRA
ncbi:MAG: HPr-rel-A system PqqD family peptide chaperone [Sphingomonadaceae bacterium]|nr:HPr-rel-A system PqqD family peptide chaperone [Sphingomonadaceae bacterium]